MGEMTMMSGASPQRADMTVFEDGDHVVGVWVQRYADGRYSVIVTLYQPDMIEYDKVDKGEKNG